MRISDWSSDVCSSDLAVADITHHMTAAIFEAGTKRQGRIDCAAIGHRTGREGEIAGFERAGNVSGSAVAVVVERILAVELEAFELGIEHKVDYARNRDRKSKSLNSSHECTCRMPASA